MKTFFEVSKFCNEGIFYDHYKIERVIELNDVNNFTFTFLFERCFCMCSNGIRVLGVTDDISLLVINRDVEKTGQYLKKLRVCFLQLLCMEKSVTKKQMKKIDGFIQ